MDPEFWLENWQNNKIGFHQSATNGYLTRYWPRLALKADSQVLVPLCGKSLDLLWLSRQGHPVTGVELSELAVKAFFAENQLAYNLASQSGFNCYSGAGISLLQGDFFNLSRSQLADVAGVFDRAALVALPGELRRRYAEHLKLVLPPVAQILLVSFEYPQAAMPGPPFSVEEAEVQRLFQDKFDIEIVCDEDSMADYPAFMALGLPQLREKAYRLSPRRRSRA